MSSMSARYLYGQMDMMLSLGWEFTVRMTKRLVNPSLFNF